MDGSRGRTGELLVDDRLDECGEMRRRAPADANRPSRPDQAGEDRVARRQDAGRLGMRHPPGPGFGGGAHRSDSICSSAEGPRLGEWVTTCAAPTLHPVPTGDDWPLADAKHAPAAGQELRASRPTLL